MRIISRFPRVVLFRLFHRADVTVRSLDMLTAPAPTPPSERRAAMLSATATKRMAFHAARRIVSILILVCMLLASIAAEEHACACVTKPMADQQAAQRAHDAHVAGPGRGVANLGRLWPNGGTIRVRLLTSEEPYVSRIRAAIAEWQNHVNINFVYSNDAGSEWRIRVAADLPKGTGGFTNGIGTELLCVPFGLPNIHIRSDSCTHGVLLHEFGHALGFEHEARSPNSLVSFRKQELYDYFSKIGWGKSDVDTQILSPVSAANMYVTSFDPDSIMMYYIPARCTHENVTVGGKSTLSVGDTQMARIVYPRGDINAAKKERIAHLSKEVNALQAASGHLLTQLDGAREDIAKWTPGKSIEGAIATISRQLANERIRNEEFRAELTARAGELREQLKPHARRAAPQTVTARYNSAVELRNQTLERLKDAGGKIGQVTSEILSLGNP